MLHLALVLGTLLTTQAPALRGDGPDARALFDQGRTALTTGRFAEARDLFRRSLERVPKPGSAFNLAVALRGTGEATAAVATLDQLLSGAYGPLDKSQRSEAEALRTQARADVATLRIRITSAAPATVRVDGRATELPADGALSVDAGTHVVEASAPGHRTAEARVDVVRGATAELRLALTPLAVTGTLILEGEPDDRVRVVGVAEAAGALERALDPGRYVLEAEGPSGGRRTLDAEIVAGQTLRVRLQPESRGEDGGVPWLWLGVGGAVVTIAAVVITAVAVSGSGPEPISDPTYGVIQTLRPF